MKEIIDKCIHEVVLNVLYFILYMYKVKKKIESVLYNYASQENDIIAYNL